MKVVKLKFTIEFIAANIRSSLELFNEIEGKEITVDDAKVILTEQSEKFLELYKNNTDELHQMLTEIRTNEKLKELAKTYISNASQTLEKYSDNFQHYLENGSLTFEITDIKTIKSGDYVVLPSIQWGLSSLQTLNQIRNQFSFLSESDKTEKSKELFNKIFTDYISNHELFIEQLDSIFPTDDDKSNLYKFIADTFEQLLGSKEIEGNLHGYLLGGIKSKCWTLDKFKVS